MQTQAAETGQVLTLDAHVQLRIAHLNLLQGVIGRMATSSSSVKNLVVTLVAASLALAFDKSSTVPLFIACGATVLFGILDVYYLHLEQGFRAEYDRVAKRPMESFEVLLIKGEPTSLWNALFSISILPFYLAMFILFGIFISCEGLL